MSHSYLLQLYTILDNRILEAQKLLERTVEESGQYHNLLGRIRLLEEFKTFLHDSFHHKLPRAVQRQLKNK